MLCKVSQSVGAHLNLKSLLKTIEIQFNVRNEKTEKPPVQCPGNFQQFLFEAKVVLKFAVLSTLWFGMMPNPSF